MRSAALVRRRTGASVVRETSAPASAAARMPPAETRIRIRRSRLQVVIDVVDDAPDDDGAAERRKERRDDLAHVVALDHDVLVAHSVPAGAIALISSSIGNAVPPAATLPEVDDLGVVAAELARSRERRVGAALQQLGVLVERGVDLL